MPLDQWVEENRLEEFRDKHVKIHLEMGGELGPEDVDTCTRLIMISLRQELKESWKRLEVKPFPPFYIRKDKK